jgi:hypothetical protein
MRVRPLAASGQQDRKEARPPDVANTVITLAHITGQKIRKKVAVTGRASLVGAIVEHSGKGVTTGFATIAVMLSVCTSTVIRRAGKILADRSRFESPYSRTEDDFSPPVPVTSLEN